MYKFITFKEKFQKIYNEQGNSKPSSQTLSVV